jgi:uncharacterized protein (TIGR02145 family)
MNLNKFFTLLFALVSSLFVACSDGDKTAGGTTEDAGIIADLNVAGLTQKGPFAKGSAVTVQGVDCQTMELTGEKFTGSVKSDKGDFGVEDVNLSATCALFEVTGYYFNELTGKKSSEKMTLHALTDLKDRKNVNINLLTQLEYERVMNLVTEKKISFAEAKTQAEKEVLAAFSVKSKDGEFALSEDLNILEKGDDNAALLAVSVMMQSDLKVAKLVERVKDVAADIAKDGSWDDDKTKTEIAEWAVTADKNGEFENVGKNIEKWGGSGEVSSFETVVENFAETVVTDAVPGSASSSSKKAVSSSSSVILSSGSREGSSDSKKGTSSSSVTSAGSVTLSSSSSKNVLSSSSVIPASSGNLPSSSSSTEGRGTSSIAKDSYFNPNIDYGKMTDSRDGQVYKTVKIGNQIWMAENLNFAYTSVPYKYEDDASDSTSWCYDNDPANCTKYGRLYTWAAAMDSAGLISIANKTKCGYGTTCTPNLIHQGVCPGGWHIPTVAEWKELFVNVGGTCGDEEYACTNSGAILKSSSGWYDSGNGSDDFGFSVIPSGWYEVNSSINVSLGNIAYYWTAMEYDSSRAYSWYFIFSQSNVKQDGDEKKTGLSVRCLKD